MNAEFARILDNIHTANIDKEVDKSLLLRSIVSKLFRHLILASRVAIGQNLEQ